MYLDLHIHKTYILGTSGHLNLYATFVYWNLYTYIHTYTHTYTRTHVHMYMYALKWHLTYVHMYMQITTNVHMYVHMYVAECTVCHIVHTYVCTVYVEVRVCTYSMYICKFLPTYLYFSQCGCCQSLSIAGGGREEGDEGFVDLTLVVRVALCVHIQDSTQSAWFTACTRQHTVSLVHSMHKTAHSQLGSQHMHRNYIRGVGQ